ncbi:MAG: flagellar export protein FliJ [Desulfohalobiaceae bacterium]|nr:flagellar export protein FliJ [Desulfohalobiaceae bacterium]
MRPFRLQSVLDYREGLENEARRSFWLCLEEQKACLAHKEQKEDEVYRLQLELQEARANNVLLPEVMLYEEYIAAQKKDILELDQKISILNVRVEQKNQALVRARQEKKVLELLKEKREEEERKEQRDLENALLDEIAVLGYGERR